MKKLLTLALACLGLLSAQAQNPALNMSELGTWRHADPSRYYNDCWGYVANGREYAILGSNWGTHFIDVTNPANPVEVNSFQGSNTNVVWRDFKTNGHYAYGVADGWGNNSLQIFDLSDLPNSVTKVYDSQALTWATHNIFIDNNKLYLCSTSLPGQGTRSVDILSLADPENPQYLNTIQLPSSAVHDAFIRNDTAYLSGEYPGMYIYNVADPMNPQLISSITNYPYQGYNHSSWITADGKTMVVADEVPAGLPLKLFDISDIQNPQYISDFRSNVGATPHNPYILGDFVIISYYKDGVQVYNIADPANPVRVGFYDTYPDNGNYYAPDDDYQGCWGVYPFLPSGNIIASDITYGLFVLTNPYTVTSAPGSELAEQLRVYPNPASGSFNVKLSETAINPSFTLVNTLGQQVQLTANKVAGTTYGFNTTGLAAGFYTLQVTANGQTATQKLVIQ